MTCSTSCMTRRRCMWRSAGSRATGARTRPTWTAWLSGWPWSASVSRSSWMICGPSSRRARSGRCRCGNARSPSRAGREAEETRHSRRGRKVIQAALKLMLEPIFEAGFQPVFYGFRPMRRAHDAIAEIHFYGTHGYRRVLDADIEASFDNLSHSALLERMRARVKDKRVLALVKAFLQAVVLTELGDC